MKDAIAAISLLHTEKMQFLQIKKRPVEQIRTIFACSPISFGCTEAKGEVKSFQL